MPKRLPHISLSSQELVELVLGVNSTEYESWENSLKKIASSLSAELFLIRYNPFVNPDQVYANVQTRLEEERTALGQEFYPYILKLLAKYWQDFQEDRQFKKQVLRRLAEILPDERILDTPNHLVECSTDATDLRMELPLLMVAPQETHEVRLLIRLANEMNFSIVPRGGGSGLTGGAVPARRRSVVLSMSRMKKIISVDKENLLLSAQTGVITLNAINAAADQDLLLTVDPASKAASSLGGNISENAGGPFAFEYGTTLDNIYSYTMVLPDGKLIHIKRRNHPGHKILPQEMAIFDIKDRHENLLRTISLQGTEIRAPGLGKDVSNKFLKGLPGVQKEGVDGIITEVCFTLHPRLKYSRVLCLEFYGRSMHSAMLVIMELVSLRDKIRNQGDLVKMSALEEFGSKYVQAIAYEKKSTIYEGEPVSVLIIQLDCNDEHLVQETALHIVDIAQAYNQVDVFIARDKQQAERFWEDRHRLSAIARRTSGFKINEDVVIPLEAIPAFASFLEELNLFYLALAYRRALQKVTELNSIVPGDTFINMELEFCARILRNEVGLDELSEQEFGLQIYYFFYDLYSRYPQIKEDLQKIQEKLFDTRIMVANHMHAGDGNCHVNIPVNSNDPQMMHLAEEAAARVFARVLELNGAVSGEHGIGITKINYLSEQKIQDLCVYKKEVDPRDIINPGKLTCKTTPISPYTFSFNRLIKDIHSTPLPDRDKLINILKGIQTCTRCGKCKQVCPMFYAEKSFLYHPRNKNITLGALIEALHYTYLDQGILDPELLEQLNDLMEHCTSCGKCMGICPVNIDSPEVTLKARSFLNTQKANGHALKNKILGILSTHPDSISSAAKALSLGQSIQNKTIGSLPRSFRSYMHHPLLKGPGPDMAWRNLRQYLSLNKANIFISDRTKDLQKTVLYFPGCGAGLFFPQIGIAAIYLLLKSGLNVVLPVKHLCCGYPLIASGQSDSLTFLTQKNHKDLLRTLDQAEKAGLCPEALLTSCGTCRQGLKHSELPSLITQNLKQADVVQFLIEQKSLSLSGAASKLLLHASCHPEWTDVPADRAASIYARTLGDYLDTKINIAAGCCAESGLGALTSPHIYNRLRQRKADNLQIDLQGYAEENPVLVGCPSCKVGLERIMRFADHKQPVLHIVQYLASLTDNNNYLKYILSRKLSV